MTLTRPSLLLVFLMISLTSSAQLSLSVGISNKFQTDNNFESNNVGGSWYAPHYESNIREQFLLDNYSLGIDFQRNKFNLSVDALFTRNRLTVNSYYLKSNGYQTGTKQTQRISSHSIDYGYLGVRISPQKVYDLHKRFNFLFGPAIQLQWKLYEREYNHFDSIRKSSSYYNGSTTTYLVSGSSNTNEFDGMHISPIAVQIGIVAHSKFHFNNFQLVLTLNGGVGFTSRMNLRIGEAAWEDKLYGFIEIGAKIMYPLIINHTK